MLFCIQAAVIAFIAVGSVALADGGSAEVYGHAEAAPVRLSNNAADVTLAPDGRLYGQVVATDGRKVAGVRIDVCRSGRVIGSAVSCEQGFFVTAPILSGGVYVLCVEGVDEQKATAVCRVWTPETAPPAVPNLVRITTEPVVRGQRGHDSPWYYFRDHKVTAALIGTAIVAPIVVERDAS